MEAPPASDEAKRLAALGRYAIPDTPDKEAFSRPATLAARLFDVPIVLVSLVGLSAGGFKGLFRP